MAKSIDFPLKSFQKITIPIARAGRERPGAEGPPRYHRLWRQSIQISCVFIRFFEGTKKKCGYRRVDGRLTEGRRKGIIKSIPFVHEFLK